VVGILFGQESNGSKQAEDAVKRGRMRARSFRQFLATMGAVLEQVRDPELGRDVDTLGNSASSG